MTDDVNALQQDDPGQYDPATGIRIVNVYRGTPAAPVSDITAPLGQPTGQAGAAPSAAGGATLTPVDGNPFVNMTPVEYDPFAGTQTSATAAGSYNPSWKDQLSQWVVGNGNSLVDHQGFLSDLGASPTQSVADVMDKGSIQVPSQPAVPFDVGAFRSSPQAQQLQKSLGFDVTNLKEAAEAGEAGLPGTGNVISAEKALQAFQAGDYPSVLLNTGMAAAGLIPGAKVAGRALTAAEDVAPRVLNDIGLYSHGAEVAQALPQASGTPQQFKAMLLKAGVKPVEMENSGFDQAFAGQPKVTRDQVAQHFQQAMPNIQQNVLGSGVGERSLSDAAIAPQVARLRAAGFEPIVNEDDPSAMGFMHRESGDILDSDEFKNDPADQKWVQDAQDVERYYYGGPPVAARFDNSRYKLPGGSNYREVLLKVPESPAVARIKEIQQRFKALVNLRNKTPETIQEFDDLQKELHSLEVPGRSSPSFHSTHWPNDPNTLAHLRLQDYEDPQTGFTVKNTVSGNKGPVFATQKEAEDYQNQLPKTLNTSIVPGDLSPSKVLHLEELQSDWGQQGRDQGFKGVPLSPEESAEWKNLSRHHPESWSAIDNSRFEELNDKLNTATKGLPRGPYVTNTNQWTDLGLKHALKEAAEGGYDRLTWTPGEEQAARYDLSKQISKVILHDNISGGVGLPQMEGSFKNGSLHAYDLYGSEVINKYITDPKELPGILGKDISDKLLSANPVATKSAGLGVRERSLSGLDLKVGGEGMTGYYGTPDKPNGILPKRLQEIVKKLDPDVKIEPYEIPNSKVYKSGEFLNAKERAIHSYQTDRSTAIDDRNAALKAHNLPIEELHIGEFPDDNSIQSRIHKKYDDDMNAAQETYNKAVEAAGIKESNVKSLSIRITPRLREAIKKGLPAFSAAGAAGLSAYKLSPVAGNPFDQNMQ
jgi:hypothetical protein